MSAPIIAKLAVPLMIEGVKTALEKLDHPAAKGAADALASLQQAAENGSLTPEQHAHLEKMATITGDQNARTIEAVNDSIQAEVATNDPYVRRMRPTFGYMMAVTWGAQMLALAYVIVTDPGQANLVITAMEHLGTMWAVALSVLGVYVYQRSQEKRGLPNMPLSLPSIIKERRYND